MQEADIAVVGAGAIGLCIALGLRSEGRDVVLVDRDTPGSGTSRGNAGVIANYECVPLGYTERAEVAASPVVRFFESAFDCTFGAPTPVSLAHALRGELFGTQCSQELGCARGAAEE